MISLNDLKSILDELSKHSSSNHLNSNVQNSIALQTQQTKGQELLRLQLSVYMPASMQSKTSIPSKSTTTGLLIEANAQPTNEQAQTPEDDRDWCYYNSLIWVSCLSISILDNKEILVVFYFY